MIQDGQPIIQEGRQNVTVLHLSRNEIINEKYIVHQRIVVWNGKVVTTKI